MPNPLSRRQTELREQLDLLAKAINAARPSSAERKRLHRQRDALVNFAATCPICRILDAAQGQQIDVAVLLFRAARAVRCQCRDTKHQGLVAHPHCKPGCVGYERKETSI